MNDDRQIVAKSRHNFYSLPHFNSKTTELMFTKLTFIPCRGISVVINEHIYKVILHSVSERESKEWRQSILTSAKAFKIKWLP